MNGYEYYRRAYEALVSLKNRDEGPLLLVEHTGNEDCYYPPYIMGHGFRSVEFRLHDEHGFDCWQGGEYCGIADETLALKFLLNDDQLPSAETNE
jgi:hypothetical protein